ncbi:hypothetical protein RFI_23922, partial [Reticulomyxa filosa]
MPTRCCSPQNAEEMRMFQKEEKKLSEHLTHLIKRLLELMLQLCRYPSTSLELIRSHQMEDLFEMMISPWDEDSEINDNLFQELTQATVSCIVLNRLATCQMSCLTDVYKHIHKKQYIQSILKTLGAKKQLTEASLCSMVTVLNVLHQLLKHSSNVTHLLVRDFRHGRGFDILEELLMAASSVEDDQHDVKINNNWEGMKEFGVFRGNCLIDVKSELLQMINEL